MKRVSVRKSTPEPADPGNRSGSPISSQRVSSSSRISALVEAGAVQKDDGARMDPVQEFFKSFLFRGLIVLEPVDVGRLQKKVL